MTARNNHKGQKYAEVKHLIETGFITTFSQVVSRFEKKVLTADLDMNWKPLTRRLNHLGYFTLEEIEHFALLLDVDPNKLSELAFREMREKKSKKK